MTTKNQIRIRIIIAIICVMGFSDWTFAVEGNNFEIMGLKLDYIISVLSWIWVFFAKLAGTFLTNKWIYGELFGLDALLWKLWNMIKNIANFGLGFYLIYVIAIGLIKEGKEKITEKLKNIILWLLIAGIGIQASRFLVAVTIDISTITLAAAGALPSQIISNNEYTEGAMKQSLKDYLDPTRQYATKGKEITIFPKNSKASSAFEESYFEIENVETFTGLVDKLMPNADDVSGPLYFMGFSILQTDAIVSFNSASEKGTKATILNLIIQGGTTIVFSIEMFVLCVLALIRIIYLRMFIVLSPLAVLIRCIGKGEKLGGKGFLGKFTKQINFKTFFINVFKPTIIVLGIGFCVILVALMNKVVLDSVGKSFNYQGMTFSSTKDPNSTILGEEGDQTYTSTLDNNLVNFTLSHAGKTILQVVLSIITVIIVYLIIELAVKMGGGNDFVSKKINSIQEGVGGVLSSLPVMPVAGYDKNGVPETHWISAGKVFGIGKSSIAQEKINQYQRKVNDRYEEQNQIINSWFRNETGYLSSDEVLRLQQAGQSQPGLKMLEAKKGAIVKSPEGKGMTLNPNNSSNNGLWIKEFESWLEKSDGQTISGTGNDTAWNNMIKWWNTGDNKKQGLEAMFKNNGSTEAASVKAYADFFNLNLEKNEWKYLKDADISKGTSTTI